MTTARHPHATQQEAPARTRVRVSAHDRRELGAFLAGERVAAGATQRQIEAISGVSQGKLSRIERGSSRPQLSEVVAVCEALGWSVELLFTIPDDSSPDVPEFSGGKPNPRPRRAATPAPTD